MDSLVSLYWILNPGKPWKTYCPTANNLADLGSRGASLHKMERGSWHTGLEWLLDEKHWPEQPDLKSSSETQQEEKPIREIISFVAERQRDELERALRQHAYPVEYEHNHPVSPTVVC